MEEQTLEEIVGQFIAETLREPSAKENPAMVLAIAELGKVFFSN